MKKLLLTLSFAVAMSVLLFACASRKSTVFVMDPDVDYSLECRNVVERLTPDGRLEVAAYVKNKENRRIQVQINCVFKDKQGFPSEGEETPFRTLILGENAEEPVIFTAMNDKGKTCIIRIRQAR